MTDGEYRPVGVGLGLIMFLLPMPFALLTLRRGYSPWARALSLGWLALAAIMTGASIS